MKKAYKIFLFTNKVLEVTGGYYSSYEEAEKYLLYEGIATFKDIFIILPVYVAKNQ